MTRNQLDDLIASGENNRLEFKRELSSAYRIARTLAAFANTTGGTLLIGVADDGKIVGVPSEFREVSKLEDATERLIEPVLSISYETLSADGRLVLLVEVPDSDEKPHYVRDEVGKRMLYVRVRDKSVPTNNLIQSTNQATPELLKSATVRALIQYLRKNDDISASRFAKLVNISDYRASKLLRQLSVQGLLIMIDKARPVRFALQVTV
ncbi:ATP-binding protein [Spirosoma sp. BT702]|uniref:ATP-binding protein n=1 Tax=Spirosoma profusum TaxID=2771354 RepID=A0A927AUH0_9BACT|nr:ATP-binding protein [Spirosoma profusum]MBD2704262.1 ATP-binding protein [Spirosoma profusum]